MDDGPEDENKIISYLDRYFPGKPAFILGSRANGGYREDSDWDIGVINGDKIVKRGKYHFYPIREKNFDKNASRNIFNGSVSSFAKKVRPLRGEEDVRRLERKAKEHIIQYVQQNSDIENPSSEDILKIYFMKKSEVDPYCKHKSVKFVNSEYLDSASEDYEKIMSEFEPEIQYRYRNPHTMDGLVEYAKENIDIIRGTDRISKKGFKNFLKEIVKQGVVSLSRNNSDYEAVRALYHEQEPEPGDNEIE